MQNIVFKKAWNKEESIGIGNIVGNTGFRAICISGFSPKINKQTKPRQQTIQQKGISERLQTS